LSSFRVILLTNKQSENTSSLSYAIVLLGDRWRGVSGASAVRCRGNAWSDD